jgi:voltage-gated potassium channel Kch
MGGTVTHSRNDSCAEVTRKGERTRRFLRSLSDARPLLLFIFGLLSLTLGFIGLQKYYVITGEQKSIATAFYNALWLFVIEPGNLPKPIPWELEIARWLSPAVAMYALLLGFVSLFRDQVRYLGLGLLRNHVIICGLGQKGLTIARNFKLDLVDVVIIELDGNNPNIAACKEFGATVLIGDARDEYLLEKAGVRRAHYLIGVCGEDGANSDVAVIARRLVQKRRSGKLNCTIHIKDPGLWVLLRSQEFSAEENPTFRLDIFNIYDQGAKQLFREFPLGKNPSGEISTPHLLIVGYGLFSEQLILNAARTWSPSYHSTGKKLLISMIDPQALVHIERLKQEYSLVNKLCEWRCLPFDKDSAAFIKAEFLMNSRDEQEISMIYVMIEDEQIGLSAALSLLERIKETPVRILVRMNEEKGLASLIRETSRNTSMFERLFLFGLMERTCKVDLIYNSSHEAISRAIHEDYVRQEKLKGNRSDSNPILVPWDCLPEEYKEMNRTQADSIGAKLRAIHCDIKPWSDFGGESFQFAEGEVELLTSLEHERWCTQKRKQGWQYGPVRDERLKLHPSLVQYGDPRLTEEEKEKDRNAVKEIPHYLAMAGYQIYRR